MTLALAVSTSLLSAQEFINTGGANFLTLPTDARSAAMAGSGTALSGNSPVFHNAATVFGDDESHGGISYSYSPWMRDFMEDYKLHTVSGFYKLGSRHAVVAGFRYYGYPSLETSDGSKLTPKEWAFDIGYSYRIIDGLSVSATLRYIKSLLGAVDGFDGASTLAVDIGALYRRKLDSGGRGEWSVGAQVTNLGGKLSYLSSDESLPASLKIGGAVKYHFSDIHRIAVAADFGYRFQPSDVSAASVSAGAEYILMEMFALRGGYHYGDKEKADYSFASAGAGVMLYGAKVDFCWLFGESDCAFRNSWFVTLGYSF